MFDSPVAAVVGASDPAATVAFLGLFDFAVASSFTLEAAAAQVLYDVDRALDVVVLAAADSSQGTVHVVGPVDGGLPSGDYETGAHAFDVYARDIAATVSATSKAGWETGPVGHVELGPLVMDQAMVLGPDGLRVVLIESQRRRPSLLDADESRRYSEGHSLVWAVTSIDDALPFWRGLPGLTVPFDAPVRHPEVNRFMRLPDADAGLRMAMICDEAVSPMRFELLEFVDRKGAHRRSRPLRGGLHAPLFEVEDLDAARRALGAAELTQSVAVGGRRAFAGVAPQGVAFAIWERP